MTSSPSNISGPSQENPILTAYENYVGNTPLVTRSVLNLLTVSYLLSWFVDLEYALACIPQFVVHYFELHRLLTSVVVNQNLISVIFACLSFLNAGKLLEESLGSAAVAWLCLCVFTVLTNTIFFLAIEFLTFYVTDDSSLLLNSSSGIWVVLFGLIAMECSQAAQYQAKRRLFVFNVPTLFYPLALLALFSFLSARFQLSHAISTALGYGLGNGKLDLLKVRHSHAKALEESSLFLNSRLRQRGWVLGPAARGSAAWSQTESDDSGDHRQVRCSLWCGIFVCSKLCANQ